jgi:hypothetical protein
LSLEEQVITYQQYQEEIRRLDEQELAGALELIAKKRAAEKAALEDALADLARQDLPEEARVYKEQALQAASRERLTKLAAEEAKLLAEAEKKITEQLKEQLQLRKEADEILARQSEGLALGPIEEREARILALLRQQAEERRKIAAAYGEGSPQMGQFESQAALNIYLQRYGEQIKGFAEAVARGFSDLIDSLLQGGADLVKALHGFFKNLFTQALKPGLDALQQALISGFKSLFGAVGASLASALMGIVGLIGMILTGGGGGSSFSPTGAGVGVTSSQALQGIVAGPTSIPIGQIGESLADALVPLHGTARHMDEGIWKLVRGEGGNLSININATEQLIKKVIDKYFSEYLMMQPT